MTEEPPPQPPVMKLIQARRERLGYSKREAAKLAGKSETWWRFLEAGRRTVRGVTAAEPPTDRSVARMALVVRMTPAELRAAGYELAADILVNLEADQAAANADNARKAAEAAAAIPGLTDRQRARLADSIARDLRELDEE